MENDSTTIIARIFDMIDENKSLKSIHENDMRILEEAHGTNQKYNNVVTAYRSFRRDIEKYISQYDAGELADMEFINEIKCAVRCLRSCDEDYLKF